MAKTFEVWSLAIIGALVLTGCPEPQYVGPACEKERDCNDISFCLQGDLYPGGICTMFCDSITGCTPDSWCVSLQGGVCLPECTSDADCREGGVCKDESVKGTEGETRARVCVGDDS